MPEQNMPSFPHTSDAEIIAWHEMMARHGCKMTCYDMFLDTKCHADRLMRFDEGLGPLTLDEMEGTYDKRWPFRTDATILVAHSGGFPAGSYELSLRQKLRVSYLPFPSFNTDRKTVSL